MPSSRKLDANKREESVGSSLIAYTACILSIVNAEGIHLTMWSLQRAAHLVDVFCAGKGYKNATSWAEEAQGNPAAFMIWASPMILEKMSEHPPEALINEVRVILLSRSFKVCWWLFCEEVSGSNPQKSCGPFIEIASLNEVLIRSKPIGARAWQTSTPRFTYLP